MEFEPTKEDLQQLRDWLVKMPHIVQDYDDQFLSAIVRASKRSLQKAKAIIENVNGAGMKYPDFFDPLDPQYPLLQEYLSVWLCFPLPQKTPDGSIVVFLCRNPKFDDASKSHNREYFKFLLCMFYVQIWENNCESGKLRLVFDVNGSSLEHVKDMTPMYFKNIVEFVESGIPVRLQSVTIFNVPTVLEYVVNIFKKVLKEKLAKRFFVHDTIDKVNEYIPREMLPMEYGGGEESIYVLHDKWRKKMESYRQRLTKEGEKMRELDKFRPKTDELSDMTGTFRQLNVD